jgi:hypothetical protein
MKATIAIVGLLLGICDLGRCALLLNTGDVFTYEFQAIPFDYSVLPPQVLVVNAHFGYGLDAATFDRKSDVVRVEAFETSTNEAPFFSDTAPYSSSGWIVPSDDPQHWQDLQGVLRFTVVTGSVVLQAIQIGVVTTKGDGGYSVYNSPTIPVPLPSLQIRAAAASVTVSWPAQFTNWVLEASETLGTSNQWSAVTMVPVPAGTELTVTRTIADPRRYYRLRRR